MIATSPSSRLAFATRSKPQAERLTTKPALRRAGFFAFGFIPDDAATNLFRREQHNIGMPIAPLLQRFIDDELGRAPDLISRTTAAMVEQLRQPRDQLLASEKQHHFDLVD